MDDNGQVFPVNEILLVLTKDAEWSDAETIAASVGGSIAGFVPSVNLYKILVTSETYEELHTLIDALKNSNNPKIKHVSRNVAYEASGQLSGLDKPSRAAEARSP